MLLPRHNTDGSALYAGRNSGSPVLGLHKRSSSDARVLQRDAESPRNSPNRRLGAAPGRGLIRALRQRFVNPKPPPCARTWHAGRTWPDAWNACV
jgi:hypothetical protein